MLRVGRGGGDNEADRQGPHGGDRGRRRRRRAAQTRRRDGLANTPRPHRPGWGEHVRMLACGAERASTGEAGPNSEEKFFSNKNWIFEFTKALEICRRRFRRNFDMRIFPKFF
jgi:hypothetical protein